MDGVQQGPAFSYTQNATGGGSGNVWVGYDTNYFNGIIDDLRILDTARSADWVAAQHSSGRDTFVTYGYEQAAPGNGVLASSIRSSVTKSRLGKFSMLF